VDKTLSETEKVRQVFKYSVPITDFITLSLPAGAEILTFGLQHNTAFIWALVDSSQPAEYRKFRLAGTGHPINETNLTYIGTITPVLPLGSAFLVFHLFEVK
jgi:hypothetical protein